MLVKKYLKKQFGSKIADKITSKPHNEDKVNNERYISPKERQKITDELKLA